MVCYSVHQCKVVYCTICRCQVVSGTLLGAKWCVVLCVGMEGCLALCVVPNRPISMSHCVLASSGDMLFHCGSTIW